MLAVLAAVSHPHSTHQFQIGEFALEPSKIFLGGSSCHPSPPEDAELSAITDAIEAYETSAGPRARSRMWPDISEGRMFANWLRSEHGVEVNDPPTDRHVFEDGRGGVNARAYPEALLADFRRHVREVWMPQRCLGYFNARDSGALPNVMKLLPAPGAPIAISRRRAG